MSVKACRRLPAPESFVFTTTKLFCDAVKTTSLPSPPAYVIVNSPIGEVTVDPSARPANVPVTASAPSLLMIVNELPDVIVLNASKSKSPASVTVPVTLTWS